MKPRLIIIRGNSGSGKSTIAEKLRDESKSGRRIAIVGQDYLRRFILKEKEVDNGDNIGLIKQTVEYCLKRDYDVILEGIFYSPRHDKMLKDLLSAAPNHFVYYMDVSLEETLRRHETKPNAHEFGEKEMKDWYNEDNSLNVEGEAVIHESNMLDETVKRILGKTRL